MVQVGAAVALLSTSLIDVEQQSGTYTAGRWVPGVVVLTAGILAAVQPGNYKLSRNPDGQSIDRVIEVYLSTSSPTVLNPGDRSLGRPPDVIRYPASTGRRYQVEFAEAWEEHGYRYAVARALDP